MRIQYEHDLPRLLAYPAVTLYTAYKVGESPSGSDVFRRPYVPPQQHGCGPKTPANTTALKGSRKSSGHTTAVGIEQCMQHLV